MKSPLRSGPNPLGGKIRVLFFNRSYGRANLSHEPFPFNPWKNAKGGRKAKTTKSTIKTPVLPSLKIWVPLGKKVLFRSNFPPPPLKKKKKIFF